MFGKNRKLFFYPANKHAKMRTCRQKFVFAYIVID